MISKILLATAAMMIAMTADCSADPNTGQTTITPEPRTLTIYPDNEKIKTDLIGHTMYVAGGFPRLWEFSSPSTIKYGSIRSTRRKGDLLEFSVSLILVDYKTEKWDVYRAETVMMYKEVAGSLELLSVQGNTIKKLESAGLIMPNYLLGDC